MQLGMRLYLPRHQCAESRLTYDFECIMSKLLLIFVKAFFARHFFLKEAGCLSHMNPRNLRFFIVQFIFVHFPSLLLVWCDCFQLFCSKYIRRALAPTGAHAWPQWAHCTSILRRQTFKDDFFGLYVGRGGGEWERNLCVSRNVTTPSRATGRGSLSVFFFHDAMVHNLSMAHHFDDLWIEIFPKVSDNDLCLSVLQNEICVFEISPASPFFIVIWQKNSPECLPFFHINSWNAKGGRIILFPFTPFCQSSEGLDYHLAFDVFFPPSNQSILSHLYHK